MIKTLLVQRRPRDAERIYAGPGNTKHSLLTPFRMRMTEQDPYENECAVTPIAAARAASSL